MNDETPDNVSKTKIKLWQKRIALVIIGLAVAIGFKFIAGLFQGPIPPSDFPKMGGDFTLDGASGPVSLHDFKGKVAVIYFGYTHCPDVCPASLTNIATAFGLLKENELEKIQGIFISLDPARDSVEVASKFALYFHRKIIGLTGTPKNIYLVSKNQYFIAAQKEISDSADDYTLSHNSYFFVVRPDGLVGNLLPHDSTPEDIAVAIRKWLPWTD